ncbi:sphingosine kinase 1 isoform X3 [Zalophus californianus]|uniref:Sphingosine kinase 1 n=1 Tax=Zalophus californianus TaxID=9704 RepID=A0A6J2FLL0_ZALCA|nr:sphingosine kinase 1 isoform X3 [Zalophus californianus]
MPERAAPRAWSEDLAGRSPPQGAVPDSASAVSSPSDPAAAGDDAGASTAPAPGGEGDPLSPHRDARLGSTDKELKAGAAAAGSSPTALGTPWQRELRVEVMDPERRNHARELVQVEELGRWDALVVMSGDGLMHEVVNGLMERPDWETAIRKPLCSLPAGSGNALAASLNHYAGYEQVTNEDLLTNCTLLLCRRLLAPMNLLSLQTASGLRLFSVLSLAWGFIADVDLESEKFRRLGEMRFTLGTFLRLAALRVYQGTLAYLPAERVVSQVPAPPSVERQDQQGPTDAHLVPLEEPVPPHWTVVPEQDFVLVLALLHSHLGSEMFAAPMGRCAAGTMHLFYVRAGVSRAMLLRLFLAMEKGRHMDYDCPYLVYVPVVAFRLEPKDGKGVFAVDGELMVSEAVQGQVHPDYIWMAGGCMEPPPSQKPQQGAPPGEPL